MSEEISFHDFQALYGPWRPLPPKEVVSLFWGSRLRWWIGGGFAVDAAARVARVHEDVDVVVLRDELAEVRRLLVAFHLWQADSGALKPLAANEDLREEVSQLWVRRDAYSPWLVDILLTPADGDDWLYKRDHRIRRPLASIGFMGDDGINYLRPEIVLLFKARLKRLKDELDFEVLLPHMSPEGRDFLARALRDSEPGHPWLSSSVGDRGGSADIIAPTPTGTRPFATHVECPAPPRPGARCAPLRDATPTQTCTIGA